jgi:hypothetical protein
MQPECGRALRVADPERAIAVADEMSFASREEAAAAIEDQEYARRSWEYVREERKRLSGELAKLGGAVAKPVSKRTRWSEQQIRTAIGLALFAWALYRVLRPAVRAIRNR